MFSTARDVPLTADLSDPSAIPYFLWDDPMTVADLRRRLAEDNPGRLVLLAKMLREARDTDVWKFTTPAEVAKHWTEIARRLGRRRPFWEFLLATWREAGLLAP